MKRNKRTLVCILLAFAMIIVGLTPVPTEAKTQKVRISSSILGINGKASIWLPESAPKGASYTYASSNPSVASVNKKGHVTGKKAGSTTIRVTQHYKGKAKALNSVKVTVKNAHISSCYKSFALSTQPGAWEDIYSSPVEETTQRGYMISCGNPKAVYKMYSANPKKIKASGNTITYVSGKDGDKVKITVKETYNKKTKTIGSFTVVLRDPKLTTDAVTWYTGHTYSTWELVSNQMSFKSYFSEAPLSDQQIKEIGEQGVVFTGDPAFEYEYGIGNASAPKIIDSGTRYFYCYLYNYNTKKYEYIGDYVTIHLVKAPLTSLEILDSDKTVELTANGAVSYVKFVPNPHSDQFDLERLTITSSDPLVVDVYLRRAQTSGDHTMSQVSLKPHSPGTATITIEADGVQESFTVIVK